MTQKDIIFLSAKLISWTKPLKPKKTPNQTNNKNTPMPPPQKSKANPKNFPSTSIESVKFTVAV